MEESADILSEDRLSLVTGGDAKWTCVMKVDCDGNCFGGTVVAGPE